MYNISFSQFAVILIVNIYKFFKQPLTRTKQFCNKIILFNGIIYEIYAMVLKLICYFGLRHELENKNSFYSVYPII